MKNSAVTLVLACLALLAPAPPALASNLSYTFLDFEYVQQDIEASGFQVPVPTQTVSVVSRDGDGIAFRGSLALPGRIYVGGSFKSSIVDVDAVVINPLVTTEITDNYDFILSRLNVGYVLELGENLDLIAELSADSADLDFGSFAGESFDTEDAGAGASIGFRWNPNPNLEVFGRARYSSVANVDLTTLEFDSDTYGSVGMRWYFFEDVGIGVDFESGEVDTFSLTMRFSFGTLPW